MKDDEKNENKIVLDISKILEGRPDLTKELLLDLSLRNLLKIQEDRLFAEWTEKTKNAEFVRRCKKFYHNYHNFTKYVPESVILMGLAKCNPSDICIEEVVQNLPYNKDYYEILEKRKGWRGPEYAIRHRSDYGEYHTDEMVGKEILLYYYPEIGNFSFKIYTFKDIFDCFYLSSYDNNEKKESLYVSLIDVILGDAEAIINTNVEKGDASSRSKDYFKDRNEFFKQDYVMDFLDLIRNKRNPDAIVLSN